MNLHPPTPLSPEHQVNAFACGESIFDDWLKRRALATQSSGASRTFVIADDERQVMGYYSLAAGAVAHQGAPRSVRQNLAAPIPVMVLACLAVDVRAQGRKLGPAMLHDAFQRSLLVSQNTGVRSLVVHAINESGQRFYEHYGFKATSTQPITLMLRLNHAPSPIVSTR